MKLWRYIQGYRKGAEAHRIEEESMTDPFLADALDGFDKVKGNHTERIKLLREQVKTKSRRNIYRYSRGLAIAASILLIIGIGTYFLVQETEFRETTYIAFEDLPVEILPQTPPVRVKEGKEKEEKENVLALHQRQEKERTRQEETAFAVMAERTDEVVAKEPAPKAQTREMEESILVPLPELRIKSTLVDTDKIMPAAAMNEDRQMLDEVVVDYAEKKKTQSVRPKPVAGKRAFEDYLKKNLVRPTDDECRDAKGKVTLSFYVDQQGKPYNITIKKGLCPSADSEAIRLIVEGPEWTIGEKEVTVDIKF